MILISVSEPLPYYLNLVCRCITYWPIWDLDGDLSPSSSLKNLMHCLGSDPCMHNLEVCPGIHTTLCDHFSISFLSVVSTVLPDFLEFSFSIFQPEIWVFMYLALLYTFYDLTCIWGQVVG